MMISIQISGIDKAISSLDPSRFETAMGAAIDRGAAELRDTTKTMPAVSASRTGYAAKGIPVAPKYGGALRQGISKRKLSLMAAEVYTGGGGTDYGLYVHEGTKKMQARPFFQWALEDFNAMQRIERIVVDALQSFADA